MTRAASPLRANRKHLTPKQRVVMYARQSGLCGCGCGERMNDGGKGDVGEHVWWFVALGCDQKPDMLYRKECAARKTGGPRGDLSTIAHVRRLAEQRTQADRRGARGYALIQSRGFDKTLSRKFSGEVAKR